jgi:hypothetical protein
MIAIMSRSLAAWQLPKNDNLRGVRLVNRLAVILAAMLPVTTAVAQSADHGMGHGARPMVASRSHAGEADGEFAVRSFGAWRAMLQGRDYAAKTRLADVMASGATVAVGALSGLRGEITMSEGRFVVSHGGGCSSCPPPHAEEATLLATARVTGWSDPIPLPEALDRPALDRFIVEQAEDAGLDVGAPFPVRLRGTLLEAEMHVIQAPNPAFEGHESSQPMAIQDIIEENSLEGEVVAFHAPPRLAGVITHPGEPFHYHWIDEDRSATAHIDAFALAAGSVLFLPRPAR